MDRTVTTIIDPDRCIGCGLCVRVCPAETISLEDGVAVVSGAESINCGHCEAVCPTGAVRVEALSEDALAFETVQAPDRWVPHGEFPTADLITLMRSRRSCRNFTEHPVEPQLLRDLVRIGITAPSGSNRQAWTFTVLPDRRAVLDLGESMAAFFRGLNRKAANPLLRGLLGLIGQKQLNVYYRDYYQSVEEKLAEWAEEGKDCLFWGAPAVIVVGSTPEAACPAEDALLATGNMLLGAHAMGLGTCLIGFAVAAMKNDPGIAERLGIPRSESVHAVIAIGWPDESYQRPTGRKLLRVRFHDA